MTNQPETTDTTRIDRVRGLVEEILDGTPHFVVDVSVRGAAGAQSVAVFLDSDGALGADELARLHRELGFLLDAEAVFPKGYLLTVSTPGLDKPLRLPRQYRKNVGRVLRVHYRRPDGEGHTETTGRLESADDEGLVVAPEKGEARRIGYADVVWAKVQLPW